MSIDAVRLTGGELNVCHEDGTQTTFGPLGPGIGVVSERRVVVRCARCAAVVGRVDEWWHDDQLVIAFFGRAVRIVGGEAQHYATYALLQPSHGTPPVSMCPEHGPLKMSIRQLERFRLDSHARQRRAAAGATPIGRVTRSIKVAPAIEGWSLNDTP